MTVVDLDDVPSLRANMLYGSGCGSVRISYETRKSRPILASKVRPQAPAPDALFANFPGRVYIDDHIGLGNQIEVSCDLFRVGFVPIGGVQLDNAMDKTLVEDKGFTWRFPKHQKFVVTCESNKPAEHVPPKTSGTLSAQLTAEHEAHQPGVPPHEPEAANNAEPVEYLPQQGLDQRVWDKAASGNS